MIWIWVSAALLGFQIILTVFMVAVGEKLRRIQRESKRRLAAIKVHEALLEGFARGIRAGAAAAFAIDSAEDENDERGPIH